MMGTRHLVRRGPGRARPQKARTEQARIRGLLRRALALALEISRFPANAGHDDIPDALPRFHSGGLLAIGPPPGLVGEEGCTTHAQRSSWEIAGIVGDRRRRVSPKGMYP